MPGPEAVGVDPRQARGHAMKLATFLPALAVLGLSGCVTGYGYSDDGYYYSQPSASIRTYGSVGYGSPGGWGYGYGMAYGSPGYYGYYDPYSGYYYDPYYGYYFPRPPVVIVRPPPGHGHDDGDHDHDDDDHDGHRPPPWRDLDNLGDREPKPVHAPDAVGGSPRRLWQPSTGEQSGIAPRPPQRVRLPDPTPPRQNRIESPPRPSVAPPMPRMDDAAPAHKGDRRL